MNWAHRYFNWMRILVPKPPRVPPVVVPVPLPPRRCCMWVAENLPSPIDLTTRMLMLAPADRWCVALQWGKNLGQYAAGLKREGIEVRLWGSCGQISQIDLAEEIAAVQPSRVVVQIEGRGELEAAQSAYEAGLLGVQPEAVISGWGDFSPPAWPPTTRTWVEAYFLDEPWHADLPRHLGDASGHGWPTTTPLIELGRPLPDGSPTRISRYTGTESWRVLGVWDYNQLREENWADIGWWLGLP